MLNKSGFDFARRQAMARNVHDVVDTAADPVIAVVVTASTITGEL